MEKEYEETARGGSWAYDLRGERLFLWFEESNGAKDWMSNLRFGAVPYRDMNPSWQCHAGFLSVWESIKPYLADLIFDMTVKEVIITGYSHGAAQALLCHEYIWYRRRDLRARLFGFGFGCPRVLYGCVPPEVAPRWERFYLIRNGEDLVTHLPPRALGFCHVGNLITIGDGASYSPIDAHRPESYLAELKKLKI